MDRSLDGGPAAGRGGASGGGRSERRRTERSGARRGGAAGRRVFTAEDEARLRRLTAEIDVERVRQAEGTQGHLRLGRSLGEIRRRRLYLLDGCPDFWQWAQARFGWEEKNQAQKYIRAARRVDPEAAAGYVLGISALDLLGRVARGDQAALLRGLGPEGSHIEERQLRKVVPRLPGKGRRANLQDCLRQLDRLLLKEEEILGRLRAQLGAEAAPGQALAELGARQEAVRALLRGLGPAGAALPEGAGGAAPRRGEEAGCGETEAGPRAPRGDGAAAASSARGAAREGRNVAASSANGAAREDRDRAEDEGANVFSDLLLPPAAPGRRAHAPLPAEAEERAPAPQLDLGCLSAVVDPQTLAALEREAAESRRAAPEGSPSPAAVMAPGVEDVDAGEEYTPLPPPPGPALALPPRFEAADEATPLLRTAAVAGDGDLSSVGLLGLRYKSWEPLGLSYAAPFAMGLFGVPGAGKSYALGAVVEGALQPLPALNHLRRPLCAVSLHYHPAASYEPELLAGVEGNGDETDAAVLTRVYGARPRGLRDVVALVLPEQVAAMRARHPHLGVSVVLSSQDPPSLPGEVLALLDQVGVFRHESAEWARHLGRANAAFARLPVKATAELPPGLLWYWARRWQVLRDGWAEPEGPLLLAARPRASRHGG